MYIQSKPTSCAILALKPSYAPGASMMSFSASSWRRRVAAGMGGWLFVSFTSVMVYFFSAIGGSDDLSNCSWLERKVWTSFLYTLGA